MRTFKLTLAYDGTAYSGWQVQPGVPTLQAAMEKAILRITGENLRVVASGRTDAGVHALGQVVSFNTASRLSCEVIQKALNAELPRDVAVLAVDQMSPGFHAIRDARRKRYRYVIHDGRTPDVFRRRYSWHHRGRLDAEAMHRAARTLLGTHDFRSFETSGAERATSVRTILDISVQRGEGDQRDFITLEVEANGFLYNMVRTIAGTLAEVGRGAKPETWPLAVVEALDRRAAGMTAPPQGLFLVRVEYD
jgi:tRNA pseudouridine38-40 synthase